MPPSVAHVPLSSPVPAHPFYSPHFNVTEKFPQTEIFGLYHPSSSPYLSTEIRGVQISQLPLEGFDELALFAAERKVLIFRDQDFKDFKPERQIEITRHFGQLQKHPTAGNVKGYPEFQIVYRDVNHDRVRGYLNPPGTTFFFILDQPKIGCGGDTLYLSQVEAYSRLSLAFQQRLEGLRAVHSAVTQAENAVKRGRPVRREPIETEHPIVRVHPVTHDKALFVHKGYTKRIVGFKPEESDLLLNFLFDHSAKGADYEIRATHEPGTVVVWDNRLTIHSATEDFDKAVLRHAVRLTPQAEVPIPG
ncbi:hypothetical protein FB451DRAFT_1465079 [Mycena latifolia]|nr:hypothetical protein FB451DRAFT_1465079 [Mycena latifolia]